MTDLLVGELELGKENGAILGAPGVDDADGGLAVHSTLESRRRVADVRILAFGRRGKVRREVGEIQLLVDLLVFDRLPYRTNNLFPRQSRPVQSFQRSSRFRHALLRVLVHEHR